MEESAFLPGSYKEIHTSPYSQLAREVQKLCYTYHQVFSADEILHHCTAPWQWILPPKLTEYGTFCAFRSFYHVHGLPEQCTGHRVISKMLSKISSQHTKHFQFSYPKVCVTRCDRKTCSAPNMDNIYERATTTIVAAAGKDSEYG